MQITAFHVRSTCDVLEIPHIEVTADVEYRHDALTINMHPRPEVIARAFLDVVKGLGWETMAIAYDFSESLVYYQEFFKMARDRDWNVLLFQVEPDEPLRDMFWRIKQAQVNNIILDVRQEHVIEALRHVKITLSHESV